MSAGQPLTKIARLIDLVPKLVEAMPGHSGGSFKLSCLGRSGAAQVLREGRFP